MAVEDKDGRKGVELGAKNYDVNSYLDTYDGKFLPGSKVGGKSFLGPRSVMAHSVHCTDKELARMAETGTSIAHCPVSQLFLGSGTRGLSAVGLGRRLLGPRADAAEVVRAANNSVYGLQAGVWTRDINKAHGVARALRAGTVHVNSYDEDDITVPFGGFKQSGVGRDKSLHAFDKYTETKTTWIRIDSPV